MMWAVALLDGHGFEQVEAFALWDAFDDVDQDNVGEFFGSDPVGGGGADIAGSYDALLSFACMSPLLKSISKIRRNPSYRRTRRTAFLGQLRHLPSTTLAPCFR